MPRYSLDIPQGKFLNTPSRFELPDAAAALKEVLRVWSHLSRDIAHELESSPDWQMSLEDESGNVIFVIRTVVETIPKRLRPDSSGART